MNKHLIALMVLAVLAVPLAAIADWDPSDPRTKWVQLPDPEGWDVQVSSPMTLANDFLCEETGWITDVHLWGSWKNDIPGEITNIHLSFHADVPGDTEPSYSHPGDLLWWVDFDPRVVPGYSLVNVDTSPQGWYDVITGEFLPDNHVGTWQMNIQLDEWLPTADLFFQKEGTIYWLDVQVDVFSPAVETDFGWKTSLDHWNDDAVWTREPPAWQELIDPSGLSMDLAFVLTGIPIPEPGTLALVGVGLLGILARRRRK